MGEREQSLILLLRPKHIAVLPISTSPKPANEEPLVKGLKVSENLSRFCARIEGHNQSSLRPSFGCCYDTRIYCGIVHNSML